jgi:hypothetical protein
MVKQMLKLVENPIFKATNITKQDHDSFFLIFTIKTSHKLVVRKLSDPQSPLFGK